MAEKIKLTFLGTSAQIPTCKRNHPAMLLSYKNENILVDCGEGTQRQFRKAKINPGKVTKILITHKHGDHVFGLPGFLSTLNFSERSLPLEIFCPKGISKFLENFLEILGIRRNFELNIREVSGKFFETEDFYLEAEKMNHGTPANAYNFIIKDTLRINKKKLEKLKISPGPILNEVKKGKTIKFKGKEIFSEDLTYLEKGKKVSFVLDTVYEDKISNFVEGADLFVCESSFGSDLKKEAKEKLHLTSEQAGKIAKKSKVNKLILTHISQRYEKNLKFLLEDAKKNFKEVSIAKDFEIFEI